MFHFYLPAMQPCVTGAGFCRWAMPRREWTDRQWTNCCWPRAYHYFCCMRALGFHGIQGLLEWMPSRSSRSVADTVYQIAVGRWHDQERELLEVFKARKDRCIISQNASPVYWVTMLVTESPMLPSRATSPNYLPSLLKMYPLSLIYLSIFWLQWCNKWYIFSPILFKSIHLECKEL